MQALGQSFVPAASSIESGNSRFFVSGRISVRRAATVAPTINTIFCRFGFIAVMSLVNGASMPPTCETTIQTPIQLDRTTVGKISDAYTNKAVKAQLIPKTYSISSSGGRTCRTSRSTTKQATTSRSSQTLFLERKWQSTNELG